MKARAGQFDDGQVDEDFTRHHLIAVALALHATFHFVVCNFQNDFKLNKNDELTN